MHRMELKCDLLLLIATVHFNWQSNWQDLNAYVYIACRCVAIGRMRVIWMGERSYNRKWINWLSISRSIYSLEVSNAHSSYSSCNFVKQSKSIVAFKSSPLLWKWSTSGNLGPKRIPSKVCKLTFRGIYRLCRQFEAQINDIDPLCPTWTQLWTRIGKSWKTDPEFFPKIQFSGSWARLLYWKIHPYLHTSKKAYLISDKVWKPIIHQWYVLE